MLTSLNGDSCPIGSNSRNSPLGIHLVCSDCWCSQVQLGRYLVEIESSSPCRNLLGLVFGARRKPVKKRGCPGKSQGARPSGGGSGGEMVGNDPGGDACGIFDCPAAPRQANSRTQAAGRRRGLLLQVWMVVGLRMPSPSCSASLECSVASRSPAA